MVEAWQGWMREVLNEDFLATKLWACVVVVMDRLPAHKGAKIEPWIQAFGASVMSLSPYYPDFNTIELWWSKLNFFTLFVGKYY